MSRAVSYTTEYNVPAVTMVVSAMAVNVVYDDGRLVVDIVADVVIVW